VSAQGHAFDIAPRLAGQISKKTLLLRLKFNVVIATILVVIKAVSLKQFEIIS